MGSNPTLFLLFLFTEEMEKMSLLQRSMLFLKKNASTILTCVGGAGVITTSVMAVKATPKALALLENAKTEKGEALTKTEKVKVAGPAYIPAIIMGASTIACIFGANTLNQHQQAALMSAYALMDNSYKEYKNKVNELYGEEAGKVITQEIVKDKYKNEDVVVEYGKQLFYDAFSERYFESTMEEVLTAEYKLNNVLSRGCAICLNKFYDLLGIDKVDYGDYIGWSSFELVESYSYCWVEFNHEKVIMDDGLEVTIISMGMEPTFGFEDY